MEFNSNSSCIIEKRVRKNKFIKLLNINSRFRNNYYKTISSDFSIQLPFKIKNVINMSLTSMEVPFNFYSFSSKLSTNEMTINMYEITIDQTSGNPTNLDKYGNPIKENIEKIVVKIKDGNYTGEQLEQYFNEIVFSEYSTASSHKYTVINNTDPVDNFKNKLKGISCVFDKITNKFSFFRDMRTIEGIPDPNNKIIKFDIDWRLENDKSRNIQFNLGWMLGFRQEYYSFEGDYTLLKDIKVNKSLGFSSESVFQPISTNYVFLSINDYNNNFNTPLLSPFEVSKFNDNNILAKINTTNGEIDYDSGKWKDCPIRQYFGPVNLNKLHIRILDEFGRIIDLNNADYSLTLSLEVLQD